MTSTEATPRYRNFSNNMPLSTNVTPRTVSSLITVEKEPERDPEEDCFMCRQAHVYIKPIGMQNERRVAGRHPPPLTQEQIDELSQKKHLTKQEVKKLLQCYFPEIKDAKYFQLHKYHSCCYDPKHLNLCKNHITALQHERDQHPNHQNGDGNPYKDYERQNEQKNKVSFLRIKIEPTKGIPTRFLGPTALPESLADMLIKQVNRVEEKKTTSSLNSDHKSQPYHIRRINNQYGSDDDDDDDDDDNDDEKEDNSDDNDGDDIKPTQVKGKIMAESSKKNGNNKQGKVQFQKKPTNDDLVVEDLDELNRLYINRQNPTHADDNQQTFSKSLKRKKRKTGTMKNTLLGHRKPKLNHWELMALEQSQQDSCNCRHHVMRIEADHIIYDWCRCKDHQHKEIMEKHKSIAPPPPPPPPPPPEEPVPPPPPPRPKPRKVRKKSIGIDATEPNMTELALAYDPSAVDYDMIQEVIYYRTSSGRLIKPEITNAFTYDTMPPAISTRTINQHEPIPNKAEVLYMAPNGQLQPLEGGGQRRGKMQPMVLSNPGSLYNGQAYLNSRHSSSNNHGSASMPVFKLPASVTGSRQHSNDNNNEYQPAEFTLATFSPDKSINTPASIRSLASGSHVSSSEARLRPIPKAMQKSTKPTYSNLEPTPDYGRESSVVANRRWFDQPLGDQNLRPVHDGQYGLIAGSSTTEHQLKAQLFEDASSESNNPKNGGNCTIS